MTAVDAKMMVFAVALGVICGASVAAMILVPSFIF